MREKKRAIIIASILSFIFILSAVWTAHQFLAEQEAASEAVPDLPRQDLAIIRLDRNEKGKEGGRKDT